MEYTSKGKVIALKKGTDFYLIADDNGEYHIFECHDELEIEDTLYWDEYEDLYYSENHQSEVTCIIQWESIPYNQGIQILKTQC